MANPNWVLGIDFGTCFTVAAARTDGGEPEVVEIDGERRTPSVLFVSEDDELVVGRVAEDLAGSAPSRALRGPKSQLGDAAPVILGGRPHKAEELVAAVLRHVTSQAVEHMGSAPAEIKMTRPATWGRTRCDALLRAAGQAGLPEPQLVEEPVAAAVSLAGHVNVGEGRFVAVYDFGGGTFDTTVLQAADRGFRVVGTPGGDEALGGELIDELLQEVVLEQVPAEMADNFRVPADLDWARLAVMLRSEVRRAKEVLSSQPHCDVRVVTPGGLHTVRVARDQLESVMRPHILNSVDVLRRCVEAAGVTDDRLDAVCLAGGMSRAPIVQQMVQEAFPTVTVSRRGDPKTSVAAGSTLVGADGAVTTGARARTEPRVDLLQAPPAPQPLTQPQPQPAQPRPQPGQPQVQPAQPQVPSAQPQVPAAPVPVPAAVHPLAMEAAEWCRQVQAVLEREGRAKGAAELAEVMGRPPKPEVTVVVAGEDKRGKSSLVNSLLGRPGLSPVGVETVTATPIVFHHAPVVEAAVSYHGEEEPRPHPLEEALSLATLQGNPCNEKNVREVVLGLPEPVLEGLVLVDTPGVGGLDSGHAALTLQSLRSADALLFVLEAGAQIRGPELQFLKQAAARTARVVFALTKVDLYRGWRQVTEDNRAILAEHAPRFARAPMVPVSNLLANRAARLRDEDPEGWRELRAESGVEELQRTLRSLLESDVQVLRSANVVQSALVQLGSVDQRLSEQLRALGSPQEAQAALLAEKARLTELNQERAEWPQSLNTALRRLNLDRADRIQGGLADVRRRYEERLKTLKRDEQDQLPGELVAELTAFAGEANHWTTERLTELVSALIGEVGSQVSVQETIEQVSGDLLTEQLQAMAVSKKLRATDRITMLTSWTSAHAMIAVLAGGSFALGGPIVIAAVAGIGTLFAAGRFKVLRQQSYLTQFRPWMNDQISRVQLNMTNNFQRTQISVETEVRKLLKAAFAERERQINEAVAACQKAQAQEQGERQAQRKELNEKVQAIRQLRDAGRLLMQKAVVG